MPGKTVQMERGKQAIVGRIGHRRRVVIPKAIFKALRLKEGDFMEITNAVMFR